MQHRARKRFGQNFLTDQGIIHQLIQSISPRPQQHIVEIGPGQGALTEHLYNRCQQLTAIEIDRDLIDQLQSKYGADSSKFQLVNCDVLNYDFTELKNSNDDSDSKIRIVGNLPYNISTPLLLKLALYSHFIEDMHFMLQKEVVERICAVPGNRSWGRLSVMLQYHFDVENLFEVPPEAFNPRPKVQSAILRMIPKTPELQVDNHRQFETIVAQAFNQKRKTIRNNLKSKFTDEQLLALDVDPNLRPEHLNVLQLVKIANAYVQAL